MARAVAAAVRLVLCAALVFSIVIPVAQAANSENAVFAGLADELLSGLGAWRKGKGRIRIALWPFGPRDDIPVTPEAANAFNDALLAALQAKARKHFEFVGRSELRQVIKDLDESGGVDDPVALVSDNAAADVLVVGTIRLEGGAVSLVYKAMGAGRSTGTIIASTEARKLPAAAAGTVLSLKQGVARAAKHFRDHAADMRELRLAGVRFQSSRQQTAFSRYVEEQIGAVLSQHFASVLSERKLVVKRYKKGSEKGEGVYVLEGTYWDFESSVDLRLKLRNAAGESVAWTGHVRPPRGLQLRPAGNFPTGLLNNDGLGAHRLELSSPRGPDPSYRVGDKLVLDIQTDREAWLYCFYRQSDRTWFRIFPNRYHKDAKIPGGRALSIPDERYAFDLNVTEPAGIDLVKCFATNRDVMRELPRAWRSEDFAPLPAGLDFKLVGTFHAIAEATVSEASLVVTVVK
ncbi:MAG: DUF4384 domain-containing protein [Alphaproteobacteria bacterium]|jgi:hypothetical protein|nr:DUF4384 domain-containing protein [Alphaproteobacteria bacterium]MDP7428388.1 DUF4384 domain-containing protein [Alphaproteobacteria bacterium]